MFSLSSLRPVLDRWAVSSRAACLLALVAMTALAPACDDGGEEEEVRLVMVHEGLESALFAVWGSAADDVWAVGADQGSGPLVLHYDGTGWTRRDTGVSGSLWWVYGEADGDLWMSGERGLIVHYDKAADRFERHETPGTPLLYGIFPLAPDDVWAVGTERETGAGVAWHYDGTAWSVVDDIPADAASEGAFFKVWGRSAQDLWIVGLGGVALHRDASGWHSVALPAPRSLFTAHGNAERMFAVGGFNDAMVVTEGAPGALADATPQGAPQLNGVWVSDDGSAVAAGLGGAVWRFDGSAWSALEDAPQTELDFHGVYVDPEGGAWIVGGFVTLPPFDRGMLAYRGARDVRGPIAAP